MKNQTQMVDRNFQQTLNLLADKKSIELNSCFTAVEKSVITAQDYILRTIDEKRMEKDHDYEEEYMNSLTDVLSSLSMLTKGVVSAYLRMNLEKFGSTSGVFIEGNQKAGFINVGPTDLLQYSPTDMEHVGWYYTPIWKGAPVWTAPYENKNININMISYIIPMYRNDEFLGVVGMDISLATLKEIVNNLSEKDALGVLIGQEDNLVYYNDIRASNKSVEHSSDKKKIVELFKKENSDSTQMKKFPWGDTQHLGVLRPLENGMSLVIAFPESFRMKLRDNQIVRLVISFILISMVSALLLYFTLHHLITPIKIITDGTNRLSRGELNIHIPYESKNELGFLVDNIRKMTAQMKEYIEYIREQTKKEREAKETAINESKNKSEFLASMYLSLHEIDLETDTFVEIHSRDYIGQTIERTVGDAHEVLPKVMKLLAKEQSWKDLMKFTDLSTLDERMKGKITIAQEFLGAGGRWCRGRFIYMDRNSEGKLRHVLWAVEYIDDERAERERLRTKAEKNAAASQAKSAFLANMSHEIRTPINAVLGMDEMILRESKNKTILGYAANIKTAGTNLLSIVNDILDFSKIEAGKLEILPENYEISTVVVDLVNMIRERAKDKELELILNTDPKMPKTLFGDSVRIKQCVLNLLTNAVKYTKEGSVTFTVGYEKIDEEKVNLKVSVKDTGSGIKPEDMEKLFAPFERIEEGKNKTIEGSGLGMSIVTRMLAMMGSKLDVKSEYGKGSDFSFAVAQGVVDWQEVGDINDAYEANIAQMTTYKEKLRAPKARLLFVDDTEMNLAVIKGLLKNTEIKIDTALSGKETLELVQKNTYDILFIDHRMPEMDGIQTLHAMQALEGNLCKEKPCIALTANAISGVKKMYLKEGFTDYLSKPVDPSSLEELIKTYLPPEYLEGDSEEEKILDDDEELEEVDEDTENEFLLKYRTVEGIDVDAALKNCGDAEILEETVQRYHGCIDEKAKELQQFFDDEDWQNYCIKVHALKSTSRLIGALELSKKAEELETLADKKAADEIHEKHKPLMDLFLSYVQKLTVVVPANELSDAEKAEISEEELSEKIKEISDFANSFNIDGLDAIVAELSKVSIPDSFAEKFGKIRTAIENVDFIGLKALLEE